MAFVQPTALRVSSFSGTASAVDSTASRPRVAALRMATKTEGEEPRVVGIAGQSKWKENVFVGGFPGGEGFFKQWIEDGMTDDIPDMPSFMQPSAEFKPTKPAPGTGVLAALDRTEFFKDYVGQATEEASDDEPSASTSSEPTTKGVMSFAASSDEVAPGDILSTEVPDEALYEKYFPKARRNLAPVFEFEYDAKAEDHQYDNVSMSMQPISASYTDVSFPKEMKNKAPFIQISYTGNEGAASIKLSMLDVEGLPTLPPPPKSGDTVVALRPGAGGGLKLNFENASGDKLIK